MRRYVRFSNTTANACQHKAKDMKSTKNTKILCHRKDVLHRVCREIYCYAEARDTIHIVGACSTRFVARRALVCVEILKRPIWAVHITQGFGKKEPIGTRCAIARPWTKTGQARDIASQFHSVLPPALHRCVPTAFRVSFCMLRQSPMRQLPASRACFSPCLVHVLLVANVFVSPISHESFPAFWR